MDSTLALWLPVLVNRLRRYSFCKAAGGACGVNSGVFQFIPVVLGTGHRRELWIGANGFANLGVSRLTSLCLWLWFARLAGYRDNNKLVVVGGGGTVPGALVSDVADLFFGEPVQVGGGERVRESDEEH